MCSTRLAGSRGAGDTLAMRTTNEVFWAALLCGLSLAGCSTQPMENGAPSDEEPSLVPGEPLCPSCRAQAGGQTSDFGGVRQECDWQTLELTAEDIARYEVDGVRTLLEAGFEQPLYWSEIAVDEDFAAPTEAVDESVIEAAFVVDAFGRFEGTGCGEKVSAPITMMFSTQDGKLQAELRGELSRTPNQPSWLLFLTGDLAEVTGTLELPIDDTRIHDGKLIAQLYADDLEVRGTVLGRVSYYESEEQYELGQDASDVLVGETANIFYAWFPEETPVE